MTRRSEGRHTSAEFNRVPYFPRCGRWSGACSARPSFSYPVKVLRAVYPERPQARPRGRYIHYDYGVAGVQDMLTSWIPLMDIPVRIGGLAVQPGGHLGPPRPPRPLGSGRARLGHHKLRAGRRDHLPLPHPARRSAQHGLVPADLR